MSDYMLLPDQLSLAIFNDMQDVIEKAELETNFWEQECKQTMATEAVC